MRNFILAATLAAVAIPVTPALADPPPWAPAHGYRDAGWDDDDDDDDDDRRYRKHRKYREYRLSRRDRIHRGRDGRYYCKRDDGTAGLVVGGIAGGVLGNIIAPGGSGLLGTILGGAAGALAGREIDRSDSRCE